MNTGSSCRYFSPWWVSICLSWLICSRVLAEATASAATTDPHLFWTYLSKEDALKAQPVEFEGTVICYDPGWGQLYVHDGQNAIYISPHLFTNTFQVGQHVKVNAVTTWGTASPTLTNATAVMEGTSPLPPPQNMRVSEMAGSGGQWVELHGKVQVAEASRNRVTLVLKDGNQQCLVYVMGTTSANEYRYLADAEVKIRGINASRHRDGVLQAAILFCPGLDQVTVVKAGDSDRWQMPVTPIDTLLAKPLDDWTNLPVHINGIVNAYQPGESMVVKDPTGILAADVIQVDPVLLYQRVDMWGFLSLHTNHPVLANAYFEISHAAGAGIPAPTINATTTASANTLTTISQIRALPKERANLNLPVRVQGVLTFVDTDWQIAFLQDDHDAIFLQITQSGLHPGQRVEVTGVTDGVGYAPGLKNCSARVLEEAQVPHPLQVDLQDTANGLLDSHWVQMEGVVHRVTKENGRLFLQVTSRTGKFTVTMLDQNSNDVPAAWIDSLVSVQGVCGSTVNSRGQLSGISLHVPGRQNLKVIDPSPADPFTGPSSPIASVATFNSEKLAGRRVKIEGAVTLSVPGQELFLQDKSGGIRVDNAQTNIFHIGEKVEVIGFPALRDFSPCLEEASIRSAGEAAWPTAKKTSAAQILMDGSIDGLRVEVQAQLVQNYVRSAQARLLLQDGSIVFPAQLMDAQQENSLPPLEAGTVVRLRGVCAIQGNENNEPASFRLLLAGPDNLTIITKPSWWNSRHALYLLAGMLMVTAGITLWVFMLRRQVRAQTEVIRQGQKDLIETSRMAGMAEIATNVLHNVGNVLNSVNVSASLVIDQVKESAALNGLNRTISLMEEHPDDLGDFIKNDPRGQHLPGFIKKLADRFHAEKELKVQELEALQKNLDHIKDIVVRQLAFTRVGEHLETVVPKQIMEDAVMINATSLSQHRVELKREYHATASQITVDRHKLLQILVNLISNAKNACAESNRNDREIVLRLEQVNGTLKMSVQDNGVGIAPENMLQIFRHGFTTRKTGHGFGLHSCALSANQMGGSLSAHSDGLGRGARFTLEIPAPPMPTTAESPADANNSKS